MTAVPDQASTQTAAQTDRRKGLNMIRNISAAYVLVAAVIIPILLVGMLYIQNQENVASAKSILTLVPSENATTPEALEAEQRYLLELEAQYLRTLRAQSLVSSRLTIVVTSLLVGLTAVVLGAALTFAGIEAQTNINIERREESKPGWGFVLSTLSPGVVFACLGTLIVLITLWARFESSVGERGILTNDGPQYFGDAFIPASTHASQSSLPLECLDVSGADCEF